MGRQVPDISPEGLKELTIKYRESVDRNVVGWLLDEKFEPSSPELITTWRESAKLSKAAAARLMGMSKHGYLKVENGDVPLTEHFLSRLRDLLRQLDSTGFEFHPSDKTKSALPFREFYEKHIPRKKVVATQGDWRMCANPKCPDPWKFFTGNAKYCSKKCRNYVSTRRKIDGIVTRTPLPQKTGARPVIVRCPQCKHEFQTRGNTISGSSRFPSGHSDKSNRKTHHDEQEQAHEEERSLLPDGLLPGDTEGIQSSE